MLMNNTVDDEGKPCSVAYARSTSADNLFTEEMEIFERQGYFAAAEEIFDFAFGTINGEAKDIAIVDLLMKSQRAIKFGKKIYKWTSRHTRACSRINHSLRAKFAADAKRYAINTENE